MATINNCGKAVQGSNSTKLTAKQTDIDNSANNDNLPVCRIDIEVLKIKTTKLFYSAMTFKSISKDDEMVKEMAVMFSYKLKKDFEYIAFDKIGDTLIKSNFEYGDTEHFNVSPDLFVKILKEAGLYYHNLEIRNELIRQREAQRLKQEEEARANYYQEHEEEILRTYANQSLKHWQQTGQINYLYYTFKYLNDFRKVFTDKDREIAIKRLIQKQQAHAKERLAHIQKVKEQAAAIYKELGIEEKDIPKPRTYSKATTIGNLLDKYTKETPQHQRKVKELSITDLNNYQPTEQEIDKELVLIAFEKAAERLKNKQPNNETMKTKEVNEIVGQSRNDGKTDNQQINFNKNK